MMRYRLSLIFYTLWLRASEPSDMPECRQEAMVIPSIIGTIICDFSPSSHPYVIFAFKDMSPKHFQNLKLEQTPNLQNPHLSSLKIHHEGHSVVIAQNWTLPKLDTQNIIRIMPCGQNPTIVCLVPIKP